MDLAGLKRPHLQALCKRHGLPAVGTNAALIARLAGVLQPPEAAGAGEDARATKGCLKRPASGKDLRETKKVSFVLEQSRGRRRQSLIFSSPPVAARSRGRSRTAVSPVAEADGRGRGQQMRAKAACASNGDDSVATEVGVSAPLTRSRRISIGMAEGKAPEVGVSAPLRRSRRISIGTDEGKVPEVGVGAPLRQSRQNSVCMGDLKAAEVGVGAAPRRTRRISISMDDVNDAEEGVGAPLRRTRRNSVCMGDFKAAEEGGGAPLRRSRRKSVCLGDIKAAETQEGVGVDKKRKRKSLGKEEEIAASGQMAVSCRVTRRSSLVGPAVLSPLAVEKKQGKRKAAGYKSELDAKDQVAKAQDLDEAAIVNSKKNGREAENCELVVQKYTKVEAPIRITRSRSTTATVTAPIVVENENKRRRVAKDAPVTRILRNRVVQVNSHVVEQPTVKDFARRSTRRSIVPAELEEKDKSCVAQKNPVRRSKRKSVVHVELDAEVAPTANCDGITVTVATPQFEVGQTVAPEETIAEKSNDELVAANFDLKINSNYEAILAEKSTSLVAESCDDEQAIIQVQQDAVHGGTQEMLSLCSTEPECNKIRRLPEQAGPHSVGNERCSSHAEQSPLGVQSLFSQGSLDSMEHGALVFATSHTVEKTTMSQPISQRDTKLDTVTDDCMHMSQQDNGQGLPEVSHEGKLVTSSLSGVSVDASHMKEVIKSAELASKVEGNKISHFEDLDVSCEKTSVNLPVDSALGISGTEFGCALHAPDTANDYIRSPSNLAELESADLLDELIASSDTEVQHPSEKEHCIETRQNQVASRPCTDDIVEATTAKCFESGVVLLPAEGSEKLKDSHLDSKITQTVESGCNCNKDKDNSNTSEDGSVAVIVGERNSSGFTLPKDYPADCYLQCEPGMSGERNVSNAGTIGNPLFEEVVHKMKNIVGTCPPNPKELLLELQSVSSKENIKESSMLESVKDVELTPSCNEDIRDILDDGSAETVVYEKFLFEDKSDSRMNTMNNYAETCSSDPRELLMDLQSSSNEIVEDDPSNNLAFPNTERDEAESAICHAENMAETAVPSDTDVFLGPSQDFSRDEAKQDCMSVSRDDAEGSLKSNHSKDTPVDERIWDTTAEKILSEEKKERESMRSSNCDILDENSHSKRYGSCRSSGWMRIDEIDSKLSSCDAEVLQQGHIEGCHKVNECEVTPAGLETDMSESIPLKRIGSNIMMDGEGEEYSFSRNANMGEDICTGSAFPDEQLNTKLKDPETVMGNCVINKDAGNLLDTELARKSEASNLSNDNQLDPSSSNEHNVPNVSQLDAPKSP